MYTVTQNIRGNTPGSERVAVNFYKGDDLAQALAALVMAAARAEEKDAWFTVENVTLEVTA